MLAQTPTDGLTMWSGSANAWLRIGPQPFMLQGTPSAPAAWSAETTINSLSIPTYQFPYVALAWGSAPIARSVASDQARIQIRQNGIGGTILLGADSVGASATGLSQAITVAGAMSALVAAGATAQSLVMTAQRTGGTGTLTTVAAGNFNSLTVLILPRWPGASSPP
jgi:hypothetical protein